MNKKALLMLVCVVAVAASATARELRNCAGPSSSFRHYGQSGGTDAAAQPTVFDEITVCQAKSGALSFAMRVSGQGGDQCYLEGLAKPRQQGVYVYLSGDFRLRIQLGGDTIQIAEESDPAAGKKFCSGSASIGAMEFRRR